MARTPYSGLRVVEISAGITPAYCGKLFTDAGAEVVKIEPAGGDPMRRQGPLFGYLHQGKESAVAESPGERGALLGAADLVITDGSAGWTVDALRAETSGTIVSVTPFGPHGPYAEAGLRVNEFVLQAMCGSIGGRGWPGETPMQSGGRIGEWVAGCYAAVAAAAVLRGGRSDVIDVSMFESMVVTMGGIGAVGASVPQLRRNAKRSLELPSIVPTADGLVGFCTITGQQFADFLVMIDRPDLIDDAELASFAGRLLRRHEFLRMVEDWTSKRTTAEIVELASAFRVPVAPIGTPASVVDIDHFRERGVFVKNAAGHWQPRVPYRSTAFDTVDPAEPPRLGSYRDDPPIQAPQPQPGPAGRPLDGLRVVDFTAFWAGPAATGVLAALGADVIKIEGLRRPDGMRFSGGRPPTEDQWWEWGPVFLATNSDKRAVTLELSTPRARELALRLIAGADLVIENFSPRVMGDLGLDWDDVRAANPGAVMVRMPAFGLDGPWRDRVGFAQTMEQASGMAWMTGAADGPPIIPRGVCDPVAGLHAAFAALAGLRIRDTTGAGMLVESTMVEAALNIAAEAVLETSATGREPRRDGNRGPGASPQGVYRAAGDDEWIAVAVLADDDWPALADLLGLENRHDLTTEQGRRGAEDELDELITAWSSTREPADAVRQLRALGIAAARVNLPHDLLTDPHLRATGFWEPAEHAVVGPYQAIGMPFRLASLTEPWTRRPAPLFGEHNAEVLGGLLGLTEQALRELDAAGVIGSRPAGV